MQCIATLISFFHRMDLSVAKKEKPKISVSFSLSRNQAVIFF